MLHIVRHYKPDVVVLFLLKAFGMVIEIYPDVKLDWENIVSKSIIENKSDIKVDSIKYENDFDSYKDIFHFYK